MTIRSVTNKVQTLKRRKSSTVYGEMSIPVKEVGSVLLVAAGLALPLGELGGPF